MEIHPNNSKVDLPNSPISHYELQPMLRSPRQQPKTLMVTSSGDTFHTLADPDTYPDLLNLHPVKSSPQHSQNQQHKQTTSGSSTSVTSGGQVLNPATLVIPPAPPAQFPHQFQHLIHHKPVNRAHSPPNQHILVSPLLSPPAQFSSGSPKPDPKGIKQFRQNKENLAILFFGLYLDQSPAFLTSADFVRSNVLVRRKWPIY